MRSNLSFVNTPRSPRAIGVLRINCFGKSPEVVVGMLVFMMPKQPHTSRMRGKGSKETDTREVPNRTEPSPNAGGTPAVLRTLFQHTSKGVLLQSLIHVCCLLEYSLRNAIAPHCGFAR
ncbi:MAG: hypothetical protein WCL08_06120 [Verrucomicrobiota bacterium]